MAYDDDLADRIRQLTGAGPHVAEKKMFGGLAFLVNGNMAVAAIGEGGIMVRVDRDESDRIVDAGEAEPMVMRGRPMRGWLQVAAGRLRTREQLARWVELGVGYARSLPAK